MKKNWFKRLIAAVMAGVLMLGLVACGSSNTPAEKPSENNGGEVSNDAPQSDAPTKLSILSTWEISDIRPPKDQTLVGQWIEEQLNIDMELVTIPSEAISTKINAMAVSGDLPTLLFKTSDTSSIAEVNAMGQKGVYLNIMDHLDKVPNYAKYLENDFIRRTVSDVDGNVYGFCKVYTDENIMYTTPIIRQDLLEGSPYSYDSIKTIEDLTEVLVYLTEQNGTAAWIQREGYESFMEQSSMMWNLSYKTYYDYEQDAFAHPLQQERFKDYILWLKDLREKGAIHDDWAIMSDETWEGMLASNKGFFTLDRMSIVGDANFSPDFDWMPVAYPEINGKSYLQPNQTPVAPTTAWVINANADPEEIDAALKLMDFLYNEENHNVLTLGIEGKTYTKEDPNTMAGIRWLIQIYGQNADNPDADFLYEHGIQSFTRLQTPVDMHSFPGTYPEVMYDRIDAIKASEGGFRPASPVVSFNSEVSTKLSTLETSMNTYFDENVIKFIEGDRSMDEWDDFVAEMYSRGLEEVVGYYNEAYASFKAR